MPQESKNRIAAILPPSAGNGKDKPIIFVGAGTDEFSVAKMYKLLCHFEEDEMEWIWKKIWSLQVTERTKCFMWLAFHNRLLTNSTKARMGLNHGMCDYCREVEEMCLHAPRDCELAKSIWTSIVPVHARASFYGGDLINWFKYNLQGDLNKINEIHWPEFWANGCYSLWTWRNKEQHDENFLRPHQPVPFVLQRSREYFNAVQTTKVTTMKPHRTVWVGWKPPGAGWVKLTRTELLKKQTQLVVEVFCAIAKGIDLVDSLNSLAFVMHSWWNCGVCWKDCDLLGGWDIKRWNLKLIRQRLSK
ncbi:ribonuclease H [Trifolium pratense]|uniref:Ribonuclease H n=1 Tax=Trifolium pratense TaxID=57577 RepID=A0A2K3NC88_TRIPR|nr:ribonuclease H [Trifolium pratense]